MPLVGVTKPVVLECCDNDGPRDEEAEDVPLALLKNGLVQRRGSEGSTESTSHLHLDQPLNLHALKYLKNSPSTEL